MFSFRLLPFFFVIAAIGWSSSVAQDATAESGAIAGSNLRVGRSHRGKLCFKYGICQGGFGGGYQGGYQGYQGGYAQQGYQVPPINIAISQSQSSANGADGGHSNSYYPNNYQFNGAYPHQGYPQHGWSGYPKPGNFNNGQGAYNSQFNGNIYAPQGHGGGYGFQGPIGGFFDENPDEASNGPERDENGPENGADGPQGFNNDYHQGQQNNVGRNFAVASSFAAAGRRSQ